jgi:putative intracellular protease/amidase
MTKPIALLCLCVLLLGDATALADESIAAYSPRPGRERPLVAVIGDNRMTELVDYLVPYAVLKRAGVAEVLALATRPGAIQMLPALRFAAELDIAAFDARHPDGADYLIVPALHHSDDPALLAWLRQQAAKGATLVAICDGVIVLGHAGLLDGRRATGHWYSADWRRRHFPAVDWQLQRRYLVDGPLISSSGVSAALPVSLALVEAIAGPPRARALAAELGLADWSPAHPGHYGFGIADYLRIAGNWLAFWRHETLLVPVADGVDDIALALAVDARARTFRSRVLSLAARPVTTRAGLQLLPDRAQAEPGAEWLATPAAPAAAALEQALSAIAERHGRGTARLVALQLEYPSPYLAP